MHRIAVTTLALLAPALVALPIAAPSSAAAETCDGRAATIVVAADDSYSTAPVTGTPGDDVIVGTAFGDTIDGAGGNDVICGLDGPDVLTGGDGNDRLFGGLDKKYAVDDGYLGDVIAPGPGDDYVDLGADPAAKDIHWVDFGFFDRVDYKDAAGPVLVDLTAGTATGEGSDTIVVGGPAGAIGSGFDDRITGSTYDDLIQAGPGDDVVDGLAGNDVIAVDGGNHGAGNPALGPVDDDAGDDVADGGTGRDTLTSWGGKDLLVGGADKDYLSTHTHSRGQLRGGRGDDTFTVASPVNVSAGRGDDRIFYSVRSRFRTEIDGDGGRDSLSLHLAKGFTTGERVRVHGPRDRIKFADAPARIRYNQVEEFRGTGRRARWTFIGTRADERFSTMQAQSVRAFGRGGDDHLVGSSGRDLLHGGPGRDRADGDKRRDTCISIERARSCEIRRR